MRIEKTITFVIETVKNKEIDFKKSHPWRKSGLHALQHGLRIHEICLEIIEAEDLVLSENELELLKVACLLHDVGYINTYEGHGLESIVLADQFLRAHFDEREVKIIRELVENHSNKAERTTNLLMNIIMDADEIDEYGILSVFMCGNWVNRETPFFFRELEERLEKFELAFSDKVSNKLYFKSSKSIMSKKKEFVEKVFTQLQYENKGSFDYETYKNYLD